ncbi:MAG: hypothetical protein IPK26_15690 [Planctomycetes bacterium]|nr:hypothetical protein [Planctomycetota bacterium]
MIRNALLLPVLFLLSTLLRAQDAELNKFIVDYTKALEFNDLKLIDKAVKERPFQAAQYFQDLLVQAWKGTKDLGPKMDGLRQSWPRVFEKSGAIDRLDRWVQSQDQASYDAYIKAVNNQIKAYDLFVQANKDNTKRAPFETARDAMITVCKQMEGTGHKIETARTYVFASQCITQMPDKTVDDRKQAIELLEAYVRNREAWEWTQDNEFANIKNWITNEKKRVEEDQKAGKKREAEGYDKNTKGIESLVKPGVPEAVFPLTFDLVDNLEELDYAVRGGPLPQLWWEVQFGKDNKDVHLSWFRRTELHLLRHGSNKFAITAAKDDPKRSVPAEAGNKPKATQFWFDADKKAPYALAFWVGGEQERVGEMNINLAPSEQVTPVFYKSAASWKATIGVDSVVFYDDNTNGLPMNGDPFEGDFKVGTLGNGTEGTAVPLLDSMRVGKGPRVPFSEFVFVNGAWHYLHGANDRQFGVKPLNPEYFKTGKIKLTWAGPKPTAPVQLVIQGRGDYKSAMFDVAGGKEIEVPACEYTVIFGRILQGKGAKTMLGNLFTGDSKPFVVEAGKTHELKMGAPFGLVFNRRGDADTSIESTSILIKDASGCHITDLQGMLVVPEVLSAKAEDGKGAKVVGKFVKTEDAEYLNKVAAKFEKLGRFIACFPTPDGGTKDGATALKVKVAAGHKVGLRMQKHPLFGVLVSAFQ